MPAVMKIMSAPFEVLAQPVDVFLRRAGRPGLPPAPRPRVSFSPS
jgi:hypothetical protein